MEGRRAAEETTTQNLRPTPRLRLGIEATDTTPPQEEDMESTIVATSVRPSEGKGEKKSPVTPDRKIFYLPLQDCKVDFESSSDPKTKIMWKKISADHSVKTTDEEEESWKFDRLKSKVSAESFSSEQL